MNGREGLIKSLYCEGGNHPARGTSKTQAGAVAAVGVVVTNCTASCVNLWIRAARGRAATVCKIPTVPERAGLNSEPCARFLLPKCRRRPTAPFVSNVGLLLYPIAPLSPAAYSSSPSLKRSGVRTRSGTSDPSFSGACAFAPSFSRSPSLFTAFSSSDPRVSLSHRPAGREPSPRRSS